MLLLALVACEGTLVWEGDFAHGGETSFALYDETDTLVAEGTQPGATVESLEDFFSRREGCPGTYVDAALDRDEETTNAMYFCFTDIELRGDPCTGTGLVVDGALGDMGREIGVHTPDDPASHLSGFEFDPVFIEDPFAGELVIDIDVSESSQCDGIVNDRPPEPLPYRLELQWDLPELHHYEQHDATQVLTPY